MCTTLITVNDRLRYEEQSMARKDTNDSTNTLRTRCTVCRIKKFYCPVCMYLSLMTSQYQTYIQVIIRLATFNSLFPHIYY